MHRSKAEAPHGGGEKGMQAIQDCIDSGLYAHKVTKTKKNGQTIVIEHVRVVEDHDAEEQAREYSEKVRGGHGMTGDEFQKKGMQMLMDRPAQKKPASQESEVESGGSMLALVDEENTQTRKRPAAAPKKNERPKVLENRQHQGP